MNKDVDWPVHRHGGVCQMDVQGRFDFNRYPIFKKASEDCLAHTDVHEFVVNLKDAVYMDSSALGMLLNFKDAVQARSGTVVLTHAQGAVQMILDVANFGKIFDIR